MLICDPCGKKLGKPIKPQITYYPGKCSHCGQRQYVADAKDYGIQEELPEGLKKIFNF